MPTALPSGQALEARDEAALEATLRLARLRRQAAVVRTLADQVERVSRPGDADALGNQLIEEVARLGCRLVEGVGPLVDAARVDGSGVFARGPTTAHP
jgi:hypothetical protein